MAVNGTAIAILLVSFLVMIMLRFQIAYAVALSSLFCLMYQGLPLTTICQQMVKGISSFSLMAVPFFITMGCLMGSGGISEKLIALANACVGWMTGGMAMVNIVASYFFGGISGSAAADTASLGSILIPMMVEEGYDDDFSTAVTITDKVEKEPLGLMAAVFFFGAMTTISAVFLEWLGGTLLDMIFSSQNIPYLLLNNFFVVAVAEEAGKFFVLKKSTWNNDEFGFAFDGIVYSVCASLGFATIENIMYVVGQGPFYGLQTAIMRAVLSVPGHCIFGVFMGTYYGIAKGYECRGGFDKMKTYTYKAFWVPVMLHGLYDFCLSVNEYPILQFIMIFVFVGYASTYQG